MMGVTGALVRQHLREHRLSLLLWASASARAAFAVASTAEAVADPRLLREWLGQLPEEMQRLLGRVPDYENAVDCFVSFKWLYLMPLIGALFGSTGALGVIARDVERRTADFVLSLPVTRARLLASRFAALAIGMGSVYLAAYLGLVATLWAQGMHGSFGRYAAFYAGSWCVALAFAAAALRLGLGGRGYGAAMRWGVLLAVGAFLLDVVNRVAAGPREVGWVVLYGLVDAQEVVGRGAFPWGAVLAGLAATGLLVGWSSRVFGRMRVAA
ncbi:MAG: ABC transporter permease [Myxococcales bacterium]|nr:ABC transporter permease [Myxococcales bacterium]